MRVMSDISSRYTVERQGNRVLDRVDVEVQRGLNFLPQLSQLTGVAQELLYHSRAINARDRHLRFCWRGYGKRENGRTSKQEFFHRSGSLYRRPAIWRECRPAERDKSAPSPARIRGCGLRLLIQVSPAGCRQLRTHRRQDFALVDCGRLTFPKADLILEFGAAVGGACRCRRLTNKVQRRECAKGEPGEKGEKQPKTGPNGETDKH